MRAVVCSLVLTLAGLSACSERSASDIAAEGPAVADMVVKTPAELAEEKAQQDEALQNAARMAALAICPRTPKGEWSIGPYEVADGISSIGNEEADYYVGKILEIGDSSVAVGSRSCTASRVDVSPEKDDKGSDVVYYEYLCELPGGEVTRYPVVRFSKDCASPKLILDQAEFALSARENG